MKAVLLLLIIVGGLVWWLGARRIVILLGAPKSWTTKRGQVIFAIIIVGAAFAVASLPYLQ